MDGKTHAPIGAAAALLTVQPDKPEEIIITAAIGAFAALLSDIDIGGMVVTYTRKIIIGFVGIIAVFMLQALVSGGSLIESINRSGFATNLLGLALLIAFCFYGGTQPHRGFTHSIVACLLTTGIAYLIFGQVMLAFVVGFASHLIADLFNKKGEQLFWPLPNRVCFGLCSANGTVDMALRVIATIASIGYLAYLSL